MRSRTLKRHVDFHIMDQWIHRDNRVLDLGCGRGVFLEHLQKTKNVFGVGVDSDVEKIAGCVRKGVAAYHGDALALMSEFPDGFFDWVLCSRTLHELRDPQKVIDEALRVGRRLAVGFANHGYWLNRIAMVGKGRRAKNQIYPYPWFQSVPSNPVSIHEFESFCAGSGIYIRRREYLKGDWQSPCRLFPDLFAGYVVYDLEKETGPDGERLV